ncbi:uncharacterized protein [Dermacentor albipictus]
MSEASAKTAVTAVEAADPNATLLQSMKDMEAIECAVLEFAFLPTNRVPTEARTFFATKIVESYAVCSRVTCEASRQSALASLLRRQLAEARREAAELRERLAVAEARLGGLVVSVDGLERGGRGPAVLAGGVSAPSAAGGSAGSPAGRMDYAAALRTGLAPSAGAARGGPGAVAAAAAAAGRPGALHKHVAFLTPVSTTATPARDVLRLLKSKVDPRAQNIRDVTLHHTRFGFPTLQEDMEDGQPLSASPTGWGIISSGVGGNGQVSGRQMARGRSDVLGLGGGSCACARLLFASPGASVRDRGKSHDQLWRSAAFHVLHPRAVGGRPSRRRVQVPTGTDPRGTGRGPSPQTP